MRRAAIAVLACLFVVGAPAPAGAQRQVAPPGNSAVDEYLETVPGADGNHPVKPGQGGGLPKAARRQLEALGADGKAAAAVANATGPAKAPRSGRGGSDSAGDNAAAPSAAGSVEGADSAGGGSGTTAAVARAIGGSGGMGMGVVLPALLILSLVAALATVVARHRRAGRS